jgi:N-acetylglucosaminyldiphosphoundecaprenol N-acetyl-beta-D-mannosaminyltransferase
MVAAVNAANADILWVGLTAPKQEKWIHENRHRLNVRFVGAIGAVFDLYAGTVKDTPPRLRKYGLQWLSRLIREPRRLWKRTFVSAPVFVWYVLKARINTGSAPVGRSLPRK